MACFPKNHEICGDKIFMRSVLQFSRIRETTPRYERANKTENNLQTPPNTQTNKQTKRQTDMSICVRLPVYLSVRVVEFAIQNTERFLVRE